MVKAVTYGSWKWISLKDLWDTGYIRKGGFVIYEIFEERNETRGTVRVSELADENGYDNMIGTMKDIVELTGTPLMEAKEMVDAYYNNGADRELKVKDRRKKP